MEGGGKEEGERGEQIDTCWRNVGEVAASETSEERDREGVCGLVKGTQDQGLASVPGKASSCDRLSSRSHTSVARGSQRKKRCALPQSLVGAPQRSLSEGCTP